MALKSCAAADRKANESLILRLKKSREKPVLALAGEMI
jgi:hypothetical protein